MPRLRYTIATALLCIATAAPIVALAQAETGYGLNPTAQEAFKDAPQLQSDASLAQIAGRVINVVLSFIGIIFLCLIVYGGFIWMTAGGSEEKVGTAIKLFTAASFGLMIVIAAYLITRYVGTVFISSLQ